MLTLKRKKRETSSSNAKKRCFELLEAERSETRVNSEKRVAFSRTPKPTTH